MVVDNPDTAAATAIDHSNQANALERKMRLLKRNISSITNFKDVKQQDAHTFEANYLTVKEEWLEFCSIWEQRDSLSCLIGESDTFPTKEWDTTYGKLRADIISAYGIVLSLKQRDPPRNSSTEDTTTKSPIVTHRGPDLGKIPIPTFSGDLLKWIHFRDTFRSMVHERLDLSKVEKFHYLLAAVKGEAASLISNCAISEDSYDQAWGKVVKTYDNPRVLARLLIHRIADCRVASARTEQQRYETFLTGVVDSIEAFNSLELNNPCDFVLSTLALRALDSETRKQFELSRESSKDLPTTSDVIEFVRQRKLALNMSQDVQEPSRGSSTPCRGQPNRSAPKYNSVSFHAIGNSSDSRGPRSPEPSTKLPIAISCPFCRATHHLTRCEDFAKLPLAQRTAKIRAWSVCFNCLCKGHRVGECRSKFRCRKCRRKHHTLVHQELESGNRDEHVRKSTDNPDSNTDDKIFTSFDTGHQSSSTGYALLGTVRTLVGGPAGDFRFAHALLDSGSQHTFITSSLAQRMDLKISPSSTKRIIGLAGSPLSMNLVKGNSQCVLRSLVNDKEFKVKVLVIDNITSELPNVKLPTSVTDKFMDLPLADHQFGEPKPIDILLGVDVFRQIITGASHHSDVPGLSLIPTSFGLIISGTLHEMPSTSHQTFFIEEDHSIEDQMRAFWEIEEPKSVDRTSPEDTYCEEFFVNTHVRDESGRFIVRLPFKKDIPIGENRDIAYRRFYALESKFRKNPDFFVKYSQFMQEYIDLGHMSPSKINASYLIPHHGVWQESLHGDKKLRVVFDASCPSSTGFSLNDALLPGPKLQEDLGNVLLRFRLYAIPLCADIVKMYRQVLIHEDDRKFQQILWRNSPSEAIQVFELNTVTYGIKPSAYQALRAVKELVKVYGSQFPLAACRILENMYVDDLCSGTDSLEEAIELQHQVRAMFLKGGFELSKWASTESSLLPATEEHSDSVSLQIDDSTKILGLLWRSSDDSFSYSVKTPHSNLVTKRQMLSSISRIFDPLGLLAPVIFVAKSLLQDVWKSKTDWDEELPSNLQAAWTDLTMDWHLLSTISIPRYVTQPLAIHRLVGFCDASTKGYSAVLYLHSEINGEVKVSLIKGKTKVAPLKFTSIPRLELCGAVLLSRLISSIPQSIAINVTCFTDAQVVLSWLNTPAHELKVFEANRVSQILNIVPVHRWHHVASEENPADLASRGCSPRVLRDCDLWWSGPNWLRAPASTWLNSSEEEVALHCIVTKNDELDSSWLERFSSYLTMIRTVARLLRLARIVDARKRSSPLAFAESISAEEFREAELRCARLVQRTHFPQTLFKDSPVIPKAYVQLSPFFDERGILRVGGRLIEAPLSFDSKHPILLPPKSHFARLVVDHFHRSQFHAGASLTLALLRGKYWIPSAAKFIRGRILRCVHCRIAKAKPSAPVMSALPKERFHQFRAFTQVGVDYAGPFLIRESNRRKASLGKAYLALFICLSSKAIHLEVVSSLSTSAFLDALERFISRRGIPNTIWSDHGTNFVGASRFLKDLFAYQLRIEPEVTKALAPRGICWKFIPPRAPHFGGLWEAGVKSVKGLLVNSLGKQPFTFEELITAFAKIEFLLNSRPLCPLNEDVNNFDYLTPGHLLIGAPLSCLPDVSMEEHCHPGPPRWKAIISQIASIWARWRKEYLHSLQTRTKWTKQRPSIEPGDLVILRERNSSFGQWPVGRVITTYPGRDGVTRVVDVTTPHGKTLTRAVTSIVPLFQPETEDRSGI